MKANKLLGKPKKIPMEQDQIISAENESITASYEKERFQ
jgi:hypothetical protein